MKLKSTIIGFTLFSLLLMVAKSQAIVLQWTYSLPTNHFILTLEENYDYHLAFANDGAGGCAFIMQEAGDFDPPKLPEIVWLNQKGVRIALPPLTNYPYSDPITVRLRSVTKAHLLVEISYRDYSRDTTHRILRDYKRNGTFTEVVSGVYDRPINQRTSKEQTGIFVLGFQEEDHSATANQIKRYRF